MDENWLTSRLKLVHLNRKNQKVAERSMKRNQTTNENSVFKLQEALGQEDMSQSIYLVKNVVAD